MWIDSYPLKARFEKLFIIYENHDIRVDKCCDNGVWKINFVRTFGIEERKQWEELKNVLNGVVLTNDSDRLGGAWVIMISFQSNLYIDILLLGG